MSGLQAKARLFYIYIYIYIHTRCAFVGVDNNLYKMHGTYTKIDNTTRCHLLFIVLLIGSTCFAHYYAHHQELVTIMVVSFLVCCMLEVRCG